jgi:diguanylate cyclase (GGDEF)-like protein
LPDIASAEAKRPSLHDGTDPPIVLDRLLWVLSELAPEAEPQNLTDFRTKLGEYRKGLANTPAGPDLAAVAHSCLKTCEQYLERSRKYVADRDTELLELISILRRTAATIVGDTSEFNDQLVASTEKFQQLAQLNDLREMKRLLTAEASTLRTAVEAKRQRDEQTYTKLTSRVEMLQSRLVKAEEEASVDPLTRVANRGTFDSALRKTVAASLDSGVPLSLAMVDIDDFKRVNDQHGHPIGDRVLLCTALWLGKVVRRTDLVARYGGEEFVVILNDAKIQQVESRLNQALADLAANSFEYDDHGEMRTIRYTVSIGITELSAGDSPADLLKRADEALYEAKRKGKNRVVARKRSMLANLLSRKA